MKTHLTVMQLVSSLWESCLSTKNGLSLQCTSIVLYNTIDSDVALAYLPTVTIVVVDMIIHENKKFILKAIEQIFWGGGVAGLI